MMGGRLQSFMHQLETWFSQAQTTDDDDLLQLPPLPVQTLLLQDLPQLPPPQAYTQQLQAQVASAVKAWQSNLEAVNCLVFLASPVEPLAMVLRHSLQSWQPEHEPNLEIRWPLADTDRCSDPLAIPALLHNALAPDHAEASPDADSPEGSTAADHPGPRLDQRRTIVCIPALELYFLRCIHGWEGIQYLQDLITQDPHRFWILGCNSWAWAFLERVCQISAYLEQTQPLPNLSGDDLQSWLMPLLQQVIDLEAAHTPKSADPSHDDSYWNALASLSGGISPTAAHLWVRSLRLRTHDLTEELQSLEDGQLESLAQLTNQFDLQLQLVKPTLPSLTDLEPLDRYLLHSLLMHRGLTRQQLAQSLGESERQIRFRVQVLRREGVLLQQGARIIVHPAHYPKLRSELSNNNFLIGTI